MTLATTNRSTIPAGLPRSPTGADASPPPSADSLGRFSHRPEVQARIRDAIRRGTVRVRPVPGCPDRVIVYPASPNPA